MIIINKNIHANLKANKYSKQWLLSYVHKLYQWTIIIEHVIYVNNQISLITFLIINL